ncbi:MAG TPA: pyridoxamine 5'-phosphate oxidase [Bacteroidales bacterium]|nr:pyridoxamine 5'-phosphate oxidase [Bacteroidales bacterium]
MIPFLSETTVPKNPFTLFETWYKEHLEAESNIPEAAFLATSSSDGRVSARTVLLKDYDSRGFTFFTNYHSRKSREMSQNRYAALLFYWKEKGRQVRIEGLAEKVTPEISEEYFSTRPRESQISAWASDQSSVVPDRARLEERFDHYNKLFSGSPVPKPEHWGGFRIIPLLFEFWENREYRLHDRIEYRKTGDAWKISRLAP